MKLVDFTLAVVKNSKKKSNKGVSIRLKNSTQTSIIFASLSPLSANTRPTTFKTRLPISQQHLAKKFVRFSIILPLAVDSH